MFDAAALASRTCGPVPGPVTGEPLRSPHSLPCRGGPCGNRRVANPSDDRSGACRGVRRFDSDIRPQRHARPQCGCPEDVGPHREARCGRPGFTGISSPGGAGEAFPLRRACIGRFLERSFIRDGVACQAGVYLASCCRGHCGSRLLQSSPCDPVQDNSFGVHCRRQRRCRAVRC